MSPTNPTPRMAVIATVYHPHSHADVIASRWMAPVATDGAWGWPTPRSHIATMYVEQFAEKDMARSMCAKHGVGLYATVDEALCDGGATLAVDGVLLIGEHGDYPDNTIGQKLYPRKELFDQIVACFRKSGRAVPIFCDKHLSWDFDAAHAMIATAEQMGFLLVSSSSIPLCRRVPPIDLAEVEPIEEAVALFYGDEEAYSYHGFEFAQAVLERRAGGETGVESVTGYRSQEVWDRVDGGGWSPALLDAAASAIGAENPAKLVSGDMRENCKENGLPTALVLEYRDGMRVTHVNLTGHIASWALAMRTVKGRTLVTAPVVDDKAHFHGHFATMSRIVEDALLSGCPPFAPHRSLLTTGLTARYMAARAVPGRRLLTPELAIAYTPLPLESCFRFEDQP